MHDAQLTPALQAAIEARKKKVDERTDKYAERDKSLEIAQGVVSSAQSFAVRYPRCELVPLSAPSGHMNRVRISDWKALMSRVGAVCGWRWGVEGEKSVWKALISRVVRWMR